MTNINQIASDVSSGNAPCAVTFQCLAHHILNGNICPLAWKVEELDTGSADLGEGVFVFIAETMS